MAKVAWFDSELIDKSWFEPELTPQAWFDSEFIDLSSGTSNTNYSLIGLSGNYVITPNNANLKRNYTLVGNKGIYSLIGISSNGVYSKKLVATSGNYTLNGQSAQLKQNKKLSLSKGNYSLSGSSLPFTKNNVLTALSGTYLLDGKISSLSYVNNTVIYNYTLNCNFGVYTLLGKSTNLKHRVDSSLITGTLPKKIYDISTGKFVKIINNKTGILL